MVTGVFVKREGEGGRKNINVRMEGRGGRKYRGKK